jgi:broad specificity phosphatase PhoE
MSAEDLLIEQVASAFRPRQKTEIAPHPVFLDLSPEGREQAFRLAQALRDVEAALDPEGLSSTARAVLARIQTVPA